MGLTRDEKCAVTVGLMGELRRFDTEFIMYGCGYLESGQVHYRITGKEQLIHDFINKSLIENACPTPMMTLIKRCPVPAGANEDIALQTKLQLAKKIQQTYSKPYFNGLLTLAFVPPNNAAYDLLIKQRDRLEGVFEEDKLQGFAGMVDMALKAKVLTPVSYEEMNAWLEKMRAQMADDVVVKDVLVRNYCGFGYEKPNGERGYFSYAQEEAVCRKKAELILAGYLTSVIFKKTYWFGYQTKPVIIRKAFQERLRDIINDDYFTLMKEIRAFPCDISKKDFNQALALVAEGCTPEAVTAFQAYAHQWHFR